MDSITITALAVISLILLSIPAMLVVGWLRQRERRHALQAYAAAHGYSFTARARLPADLGALPYFQHRVQVWFWRRMKNVLHRSRGGTELLVFDYWYVRSTINLPTSRTTRVTVICLRRGATSPWHIFPQDGLNYVDVILLPGLIDASMHAFSAAVKKAPPP